MKNPFARPLAAASLPVLVASAWLAGCSLFMPRLETPRLSVAGIEILKSDLWHQELKVRMHVVNPNDRALPVKGITYTLALDDQEFAHGISGAQFVVPARGEAEFDMSVSANMAGAVFRLLSQDRRQVEYHLTGKVSLSSGLMRTLNFDERGTFDLN